MSDPYAIRRGEAGDAPAIVAFQQRMALETEERTLDEAAVDAGVRHVLATPSDGFYLVATHGRELVASLMITPEWSDWRGAHYWWIQSVYVLPAHRRRGLYRRLYEAVKQAAEATPRVCGFRLYVERTNDVARRTYEALGMERTPYLLYEETRPGPASRPGTDGC